MDKELANVEAELQQIEQQIAQLKRNRQNLQRRKAEVKVEIEQFVHVCLRSKRVFKSVLW